MCPGARRGHASSERKEQGPEVCPSFCPGRKLSESTGGPVRRGAGRGGRGAAFPAAEQRPGRETHSLLHSPPLLLQLLGGQERVMGIFAWLPFFRTSSTHQESSRSEVSREMCSPASSRVGFCTFTVHTGHQGTVSECRVWFGRAGAWEPTLPASSNLLVQEHWGSGVGTQTGIKDAGSLLFFFGGVLF